MDIAFAVMFSVIVAIAVVALLMSQPWLALIVLAVAVGAFVALHRRRVRDPENPHNPPHMRH